MIKTYIVEPTAKAEERIARLEKAIPCLTSWNRTSGEYRIECRDYDIRTVEYYLAPIV